MKTVFIGRCEPFIVEHFHENSYTIEFLNGNLKVDSRLSNHADLSLLRISEQKFIADTTQKAAIRI